MPCLAPNGLENAWKRFNAALMDIRAAAQASGQRWMADQMVRIVERAPASLRPPLVVAADAREAPVVPPGAPPARY